MAKAKKSKKKRSAAKKSTGARRAAGEPRKAIITAALRLAELQGWRDTSLSEIAAEAGLELAAVQAEFRTRGAILAAFMADVDQDMVKGLDPDLGAEPVRDRLFDVIMGRFDALAPHKAAVDAIARDMRRDPSAAACFADGPPRRSLDLIREAAGVDDWGPLQPLQRKGLGLIYLNTMKVWFADDEADMGKTMAALNKALDRADRLIASFVPGRRRRPEGDGAAEAAA